jgi:hypothetical protein
MFGAIGQTGERHAGIFGDDRDDPCIAGRLFCIAAADDLID